MYATLVGICSVQYIIMWCSALMENQWQNKPATAETIQKQFPNWHMEGLCDWFWLLLDFNTILCELIDSQPSSCGLSTNCQMSPCLLFLLSHLFCLVLLQIEVRMLNEIRRVRQMNRLFHPLCNRSQRDVIQFTQIPTLHRNPHCCGFSQRGCYSIYIPATPVLTQRHQLSSSI